MIDTRQKMQKDSNRALRYLRGVMIAAALSLPVLSLAVLGTLWLWQNGLIIIWSAIASTVALVIYAFERWLVIRGEPDTDGAPDTTADDTDDVGTSDKTGWSTRDERAWQEVEAIARRVKPEMLNSRDAILALGTEVVEAVAGQIHPGEKDPLWKFTVPEALALVARVSLELNLFISENIPLSDRLSVRRLRAVYRWRSLVDTAEKAYDLWRILRFVNPATAIASELRESVSGQLMEGLRTELIRRVARAYVREVGHAAIDLYSNRLRIGIGARPSSTNVQLAAQAPLQLLIAGQSGSGKSSLVDALSCEAGAPAESPAISEQSAVDYEFRRGDELFGRLLDMPLLVQDARGVSHFVEQATNCDMILWVISALRSDRAIDSEALDAARSAFETRIELRLPPLVIVMTHIDGLRPFGEWNPPYDLETTSDAKSLSIRQAVEATAADLGVDPEHIVPICVASDGEAYNIDVLWARLMDAVPAALNSRLARQLYRSDEKPAHWRRAWKQAVNAGRVLGRTIRNA